MTLPPLTLRVRIALCFAAAVIGLVLGMSWLFVNSQQAALAKLAAENSELTRSAAEQQGAALKTVLTDQIQSSEVALQTKARSLARLLADLAPTALLTFDTNALTALCKQAIRDPDIEQCIFVDSQGRKIAAGEKSHAGRLRFTSEDTSLVAADALENGRKAGQVTLVVSFASAKEQGRKLEASYADLQNTMNKVRAAMENGLQKHSQSQTTRARWIAVEVGVVALILGLLTALWISGFITRSLRETVVLFRKVESGDLTSRVAVSSRDEIGEMAHALNHTLDGLQRESLERSRVEEQLRAATYAAEASSRAKSEFLANMSHEIRTPLNGVVGMTDLALETELTQEQREYLSTVKLSADSLLTVINDILDFSKIEAGKIDLEALDFGIRDGLEATLRTVAVRSDEKGLELLCEVAPEVPETLVGDFSRLRQVVVNLLGNSIKFTDHGEVALKVEVESRSGESCLLHFTVSDTGIGIPAEKQKSIFDAFSQADNSTTRKYGGTGLGLSISMRLVAMMGGSIWVHSEVGKGSQFHFTIRFGVTDAKPVEVGRIAPPEILRGVKVLIVDDNRTNRRILEGMLKRWEMRFTSVEGGATALSELSGANGSGEPYALIVTDMHMPEMDGFTLIERIRQMPELSTAIVMMLTSAGHRGDAARCQELGVSAYLLKPIRQSELREAIAKVLGGTESHGAIPLITRYSLGDARDPSTILRILLAEDNPVNQRVASRLLEKRGHRVQVVADGREALTALEKENFDLVFMDVQMPEMDGFEATEAIRKNEEGGSLRQPIIALTAHAMKGDRERCIAAGMDGYLSKPIRAQELDDILDKYVARHGEIASPADVPARVEVEI
jgi:signal transduction histidine kinase/DNA-binding response OmpR family regulator